MVTGAAALLLSVDSSLSSKELRENLLNSSKDLGSVGFDKYFGAGRLDIAAAVKLVQERKSKLRAIKNRAIFGKDDRQEVYSSTAMWQNISRSIAGKVADESLRKVGGEYQLSGATLSKKECPGNRFADQVTVPSCTGFLATPNVIITAAHCIVEEKDCKSTSWAFEYALKNASDNSYTRVGSDRVYHCKKVLGREFKDFGDIDYAIIELDRPVVDRPPLNLGFDMHLVKGQALVNLGHSSGLPLKFKDSAFITEFTVTGLAAESEMDTFKGDSGSPVFDAATGTVIGITSRGHTDHAHQGDQICRSLVVCLPGEKCHPSVFSKISNIKADPIFNTLFPH